MTVILDWLGSYSGPVVVLIVLGAGFLFVARTVVERGVDAVARQTWWQGCCVSPEGVSELWEDPRRFLLRRRPGWC